MVVLAKDLEETFGQWAGGRVATGVRHRLTATSLLLWELDVEAQAPQHAQCGDSNIRIELVDVAGYE